MDVVRENSVSPAEGPPGGAPAEPMHAAAPPVDPTSAAVPNENGVPAPTQPPAAVRRAYRDTEGAWLAGVARGIANHLGWPINAVRTGFVMLTFVNFIGAVVYGLLWVLMPVRPKGPEAPGLEAAARTNMRPPLPESKRDAGMVTALAALGVGIVWFTQVAGLGIPLNWFWPLAFGAVGLALIWRQADADPKPVKGTNRWLAPLLNTHGWSGITRMVVGAGMVVMAVSSVVAGQVGLSELPPLLLLSGVIVGGMGIMAAPWIHRWRQEMDQAREEKILADARADMAAHLHDSVLQTLALIQRQAGDPRAVSNLARRQERELRTWLYGEAGGHTGGTEETHLAAALKRAAQEVEDERGIPIEVVCVGDAELDPNLSALVSAAREAMVNAAKHSGADRIDVYGEVEDSHVEVFVRDRGRGFLIEDVEEDRQGVRGSILARMERHGGRARVRSAPGEGTDIKLEMDL